MKFTYASGSRPLDGFTIKRGIGAGGFGEVYFAASDGGKEVALKHILRNLDIELRGATQCLNLKHPNLLALFDIKYDEMGGGWLVMEYIAGESLKDIIDRNPNGMPVDQALAWFGGMAAGVAYLHDHGIVHRDLKPGNIFMDEAAVKIGDYGLSKFISCSRRSGQTESVGTFHYMAPEIGRGCYGKEIDIYALGIILCEMLTGRVPFDGESSQEIIMKHLTADPNLDGLSPPHRAVVAQALAKDPDQRFANVVEMVEQLGLDRPTPGTSPPAPPVYAATGHAGSADGAAASGNARQGAEAAGDFVRAEVVIELDGNGEEPIAKAVRGQWREFRDWWHRANFSTPVKVAILVGIMLIAMSNVEWLVPMAVIYGIYLLVRGLLLGGIHLATSSRRGGPTERAKQASPVSPPPASDVKTRPPHRRRRWHDNVREVISNKPPRQRVTELVGSLLMSAIVSAVLCLVIMVFSGQLALSAPNVYAWLVLSSIVGTWAILIPTRFWEGSKGDQFLRRFVMLVVGLTLGGVSFGLDQMLMVDLPYDPAIRPLVGSFSESSFAADGAPNLPGYLAYFAALFLVLRWWKQADPLRPARVSFWATAGCLLWAGVLYLFWPFPLPWALMLTATISLSTQLSAPWMSHEERSRLRQRYNEV